MAWELANEPRCAGTAASASSACDITGSTITTWATVVSAYIKSIDCNHLVAMGDEGWFQEANPPTYPYAPDVGINFVTNLSIKTLDFGTFHAYPEVRFLRPSIPEHSDPSRHQSTGVKQPTRRCGGSHGLWPTSLLRSPRTNPCSLRNLA